MRRRAGTVGCALLVIVAASSCTSQAPGEHTVTTRATIGATPAPIVAPTPRQSLRPALAHMKQVIESKGFAVTVDALRKATEFSPWLRPVIVQDMPRSECSYVVFIARGKYVGRDRARCSLYPTIEWGDSTEIAVVYQRWAKNDPTCCPTLDPKLVRYKLQGGRMHRLG